MDSMVEWTGERIRQLRCQLGWSRAEMSRRLSVDLEVMKNLEQGNCPKTQELLLQLDRMQSYLLSQRQHLSNQPIAEVLLRERGISQIDIQDVISHREANFEVDN